MPVARESKRDDHQAISRGLGGCVPDHQWRARMSATNKNVEPQLTDADLAEYELGVLRNEQLHRYYYGGNVVAFARKEAATAVEFLQKLRPGGPWVLTAI